jgi:hypothetical protein
VFELHDLAGVGSYKLLVFVPARVMYHKLFKEVEKKEEPR